MALMVQMMFFTVFAQVHGHFERVVRQMRVDQADRLAEAGWRWALWQLEDHPDWRGVQQLALDSGMVRVTVAEESGRLIVVAEGGVDGGVRRSLRVEVDPADFRPLHWEEGAGIASGS
ncbi:MAG: hypothetical protein QJR01_02415 [Kyrpidia sp.]|nr:hypothetical protein [Kyrpidia sp.]